MTGVASDEARAGHEPSQQAVSAVPVTIANAGGLDPCPYCSGAFKMGQEPRDNPPVSGLFYIFHARETEEARGCRIEVRGHFDTAEEALVFWNRKGAF